MLRAANLNLFFDILEQKGFNFGVQLNSYQRGVKMKHVLLILLALNASIASAQNYDWNNYGDTIKKWFTLQPGESVTSVSLKTPFQNGASLALDKIMKGESFEWKVVKRINYGYDRIAQISSAWFQNLSNMQYDQHPYKWDYLTTSAYYFLENIKDPSTHIIVIASPSYYQVTFKGSSVYPDQPLSMVDNFKNGLEKIIAEIYKGRVLEYKGGNFVGFAKGVDDLNSNWDSFIFDIEAKNKIKHSVEFFLNNYNKTEWRKLGLPLNKGLLLYGPPGTGKSFVGKIISSKVMNKAYNNEITFLYVSARHVTWDSDVKSIYDAARRTSPAVVFFEDIDLIAGTDREDQKATKNELMQQLSGLEELNGVMTIGTTNYFNLIDSALKRSKRLGFHYKVGLPKHNERVQLFELFSRKFNKTNVDFYKLALSTEDMTGADIKEIVNLAVESYLLGSQGNDVNSSADVKLTMDRFEKAVAIKRNYSSLIE